MPFLEHDLMGLGMAKCRFSVPQALFIFQRVVAQVRKLHDAGLVHRDIKSSNILMSGDAAPSLIDFGHTHSARHSKRHIRCGTLVYTSPELLLSNHTRRPPQDYFAADMWALGCVLVELLIGVPLFHRCNKSPAILARAWEQLFGQHVLAADLRRVFLKGDCASTNKSHRRSLRDLILKKHPKASTRVLDLAEKLLQPEARERPSCQEVLAELDGTVDEERAKAELRDKLGALQRSCLEHRVRKRELVKRGDKVALATRDGDEAGKRVAQANASTSLATGLKRVKVANTESLSTPIN